MKTINVGDVYFLSSIFKGNMDKESVVPIRDDLTTTGCCNP